VRDIGDHGPGGVGEELARQEVRRRLVFEVTDRELRNGVLAVLGLDGLDRAAAVGAETRSAQLGHSSGWDADQSGAADDSR
jgi:hypothetical protein